MQDIHLTTILNGFGLSLGDSIIGLQALSIARSTHAIQGRVVLGRKNHPAKQLVPQLYALARDFADPLPMATAPRNGKVIDIRDFAYDPAFSRTSMIDFFLMKLGINPTSIASGYKRNTWLAPRVGELPDLGLPQDYVLLCPKASIPLRDMPFEPYEALLRGLQNRRVGRVVTQGKPIAGAIGAPFCNTISELAALVAGARAVISTDTAILHLADAFSTPCLAFMTTHRPEWRVRDYPNCQAHYFPATGLPESLEFVRDEDDLKAARAAWFHDGQRLTWVDPILDDFMTFASAVA